MTRLSCSCERSLVLDQMSVGCFGILAKCIAVVILNSWRWLNSALNRTQLEDEMVATLLSKIDWLQLGAHSTDVLCDWTASSRTPAAKILSVTLTQEMKYSSELFLQT